MHYYSLKKKRGKLKLKIIFKGLWVLFVLGYPVFGKY